MQYSLRALLVAFALFGIGFYFLSLAFAEHASAFAFFIAVTILATLIGGGIGFVCGLRGPWPRRLAMTFAILAGMAGGTFAVVNIEWKGDGYYKGRPGPESDERYVAMAVVRCGLMGTLIGILVISSYQFAAGKAGDSSTTADKASGDEVGPLLLVQPNSLGARFAPHWSPRKTVAVGTILIAATIAWWPYMPYYAEQRANARLWDAIQAGDSDRAIRRVPAVTKYRGGEGVVGRILGMAGFGKDDASRLAALKSLMLFDESAIKRYDLRAILNEIKLKDTNADVRAAAADWLANMEP